MQPINAIRGMNDILPSETLLWQDIEKTLATVLNSFCYQEIRLPLLEKTELFKRSIGDVTDIVEKEMYTFLDRNQDSLSLRPEGTAGCVRACIEHGLIHNQIQRLWYQGPYFRHERPQKGRYRQFYQCGVEIFGLAGPDIDAELIFISKIVLEQLGLLPYTTLKINSLGDMASRSIYREALVAYLSAHYDKLDEDSQRRLSTNPLRILDSKNPALKDLMAHAPQLKDYWDEVSKTHFSELETYLKILNVPYVIDPCLVRGLDYYSKTVFEWTTDALGAQGTVCAGGRYDGLVEQLGGKPTPALGLAFGIERLGLLFQSLRKQTALVPHIYFIVEGPMAYATALKMGETLKNQCPGLRTLVHAGGGPFKNQFKKADKSGAALAFVLGETECHSETVTIKFLREDRPQNTILQSESTAFVRDIWESSSGNFLKIS